MRGRFPWLLGALATALALALWMRRSGHRTSGALGPRSPAEAAEAIARQYLAIEEREQAVARGLWAPEIEAQRFEDVLHQIWDSLNAATNDWRILQDISLEQVSLLDIGIPEALPHGIWRVRQAPGAGKTLDRLDWRDWIEGWAAAGWEIRGTRWALRSHQTAGRGQHARSHIWIGARLERLKPEQRATLDLEATVTWTSSDSGIAEVTSLRVDRLTVLHRLGPPPFRLWLEADLPPESTRFNDPLIIRDLDGDGRPELLMVGAASVWWNGTGQASSAPFDRKEVAGVPEERIQAAVLADVDGDGREDLVIAGATGLRWAAAFDGRTEPDWRQGWTAPGLLRHPQAIAVGDVDGDGDVDLWLVQYKLPYQQGQFPTPWYDARDGFSSHLLLNDGRGRFLEATEASGLGPVGRRRSYSASFVDVDGDGALDLLNVSDFAGLDFLRNTGHGRFEDLTPSLGPDRHAFGMAHVVSDANGDGHPDVLMLGMDSIVASRLLALGVRRPVPGEPANAVVGMTAGNRLFLGSTDGARPLRGAPAAWASGLAATGWSWGGAWEDFDNDGRLDLAVANGHETRSSTVDYERQFWLHDRFVAGSTNDPAAEFYFRTAAGRRQAARASYGGWQDNILRLQVKDGDYAEVAWLLGVADPEDCRNLVAADLDLDGRLDLVVTTQEGWPRQRQRLRIYRNELEAVGRWIGFRFRGSVPSGVRVTVTSGETQFSRWRLTGDSFRSQGPAAVHFGLGHSSAGRTVIDWGPGRAPTSLEAPQNDRWNIVDVPDSNLQAER
ncbi:MAG: CRTAC1 family protein [Verrucomicrobiae bacterium]|nr:CRTAC1 family protein [Verrucomicrobiae bacterium]